MKRNGLFYGLLFAFLIAGTAPAILPPDAAAREPEIRARRIRLQKEYDKRQVERQEMSIRAYEQTRADIFTPPWKRTQASSGVIQRSSGTPDIQPQAVEKKSHRVLVSFLLITLLVVIAGWVRYATKEIDE